MLYHPRARKEGHAVAGRLDGKVALITGAGCVGPGWGNGRAAAVLFAREGAKVFAVDKDAGSMTETVGRVGNDGEIVTHVCDVLDDAQVAAMTEACRKQFGRIDILVNNVGGSAAGGVAEMSEESFDRQIDYNLKTVFLTCRHVIPVMVAQGGGAIVNTSSVTGLGGAPHSAFYAAAKAAVIALSKSAALEYAALHVRVNALVPGAFRTPMLDQVLEKMSPGDPVAAEQRYNKRIPLGRIGRPDEAADAVLWLCSDQATYVTGQAIVVDGGLTAPFR
jgi:NAD(P)-dependent dehydrogenase (short-subunit alcohol dehydrogenase family)